MTRCSCKTRGITLKAIVLEFLPFFTKNFKQKHGPQKTIICTTCGALVCLYNFMTKARIATRIVLDTKLEKELPPFLHVQSAEVL